MELVYLWVEEYKNIHNQGFNFSPRFRCEYNPNDNNLTICDKKKKECKDNDYIENFFGENINVTAIVGKNGSGKSSVFEVLTFLFWQGLIQSRDDKTFFLFKSNRRFFIQCENYKLDSKKGWKNLFHDVKNKTSIKLSNKFTYRTHMPLIHFSNCLSDMTHNKRLEYLKSYSNFYNGIQPIESMMKSEDTYDNFNQKFLYILRQNNSFFDFIDQKLHFNNYEIRLYISEIEAGFVQNLNKNFVDILTFQKQPKLNKDELIIKVLIHISIFMAEMKISSSKHDLIKPNTKNFDLLQKYKREHIYEPLIEIFNNKVNYDSKFLENVLNILNDGLKNIDEQLDKNIFKIDLFENYKLIDKESHSFDEDIDQSYSMFASKSYQMKDDYIDKIYDDKLLSWLIYHNILRINFFKKNNPEYQFLSLSSGEKNYLNVLTNFSYTLFWLEENYQGVLLFDEIELAFHPQWQKNIINHLIEIYKHKVGRNDLKLHLIFTTHSPFLLSDIPKQNIIFLDTYENGNCKVVDGLNDKKETFGANIHTLLSDSFFMEDGLMGEFAKGKIDEVIKLLNKEHLEPKELKYCGEIISIIGEPIVKNQLQRMLDSKRLSKIDEIDKLQEEINLINHRIEILRKKS